MKNFIILLATLLLAGVFFLVGKTSSSVDTNSWKNSITVQGMGKISMVPDTAHVTLGVQTGRQKTAEAAMKILNEKMNAIIASLEANSINKTDISTDQFWLNPSYDYVNGRQLESGFEAVQNVQVKIRALPTLSAVLDAAVAAGANQVQNVSFSIDSQTDVQKQARLAAIEDAKKNAAELATALGVSLGDLVSFTDTTSNVMPYPVSMRSEASQGGDTAAVVPQGEQDVIVNVTVQYEIK